MATVLPVRDLWNFRPLDFCWTEGERHRPTFSIARALSKEKGWRVRLLSKTLSAVAYLHILEEFFMTFLEIINKKLYQQYEGLPAFTSYFRTSEVESLRGKGISKGESVTWQLLSPELTPLDFFSWWYIKDAIYSPPFPPLCRNLLWGKDRHAYKWVNWMNRDTVWCVLILTVPSLIMCVFVANMLSLGYNNSEHITHQTVFTFQVYASCFSSNITISRLQFTNVFTLHNICTFFSAATNQRFISSDQFKKVGIAVVMGKRRRKCCGLSSDYPCVYRQKYVSLNHLLQKSIPNAVLCKLYRLLF